MILYQLYIAVLRLGIGLASFFNPKARLWIDGRKNLFSDLSKWRETVKNDPVIWMHCASLGEFEQGRSLLEQLKSTYPKHKIVLSFYSPSGFEIRKNYEQADYVTYMPLDTSQKASRFVEILQTDLAIFVKYEFWYYHLRALFDQGVPTILISAVFRSDQFFFRWYGTSFFNLLKGFEHIFVQDRDSLALLAQNNLSNISLAGDTRIDRSSKLPESEFSNEIIEAFSAGHQVLVVGSSWPADEAILYEAMKSGEMDDWRLLIAPHEITDSHLQKIQAECPWSLVRYTQTSLEEVQDCKVLLLDTIGMLSKVYRYGQLAYIGGGFGSGIHNTLEPIAYGLPVIFGPKYQKFIEARSLVKTGGGFSIQNSASFLEVWVSLQEKTAYETASRAAITYVKENEGASQKIMNYVKEVI